MSRDLDNSFYDLLKQTSRSFYTTLRILPGGVRPQIALAYLLARTTDTIADTELVAVEQRLNALERLREHILGTPANPLAFGDLSRQQNSPAERVLLERVEESVAQLPKLSLADAGLVRKVLATIISGQELDLRRFAGASASAIIALRADAELDDYTYRVAGCVGEFWTKICRAHLFPRMALDDERLLQDGVSFGKGLQLVNILRDLPADLRTGRCYLPADELSGVDLTASDLLEPKNEPRLRPLYNRYLDRADSLLRAGWNYVNMLPWGQVRVRLGCAWPVLIGVKTIARLRRENVLDPARRIKVPRPEVRALMSRSILYYPWPRLWQRLPERI